MKVFKNKINRNMTEATAQSHEFGSQPQDVEAFIAAYDAVQDYNGQFSLGKMMARTVIEGVRQAEKAQELVQEGASFEEAQEAVEFVGEEKADVQDEQHMLRELVGITNESALESSGLTLSPLREDFSIHSTEGTQNVGKVRLGISEGSKFSSFLMSVAPQDVSERLQKAATGVVLDILSETEGAIAEDRDLNNVAEALVYADGIIAGLERLGLGGSAVAADLKSLAVYAGQGIAHEYVVAKRLQLFKDPENQGFGPATWQRDASNDVLEANWGDVLTAIRDTMSNPNGNKLARDLMDAARKLLNAAKIDWQDLRADTSYGPDYGKDFDNIFETVGLELDMLASPDGQE